MTVDSYSVDWIRDSNNGDGLYGANITACFIYVPWSGWNNSLKKFSAAIVPTVPIKTMKGTASLALYDYLA